MHSGSYFKMAVLHTPWSGNGVHVKMLFRPSLFRNPIFWNSRCITQQMMNHHNEKKKTCRKVRLVYKCRTLRGYLVCLVCRRVCRPLMIHLTYPFWWVWFSKFPFLIKLWFFHSQQSFLQNCCPSVITVIKIQPLPLPGSDLRISQIYLISLRISLNMCKDNLNRLDFEPNDKITLFQNKLS